MSGSHDRSERYRNDGQDRDELFDRLPARQQQVLELLADGLSDGEIAGQLVDTEDRMRNEVSGLLAELGFQSRTQAVLYVIDRTLRRAQQTFGPLGEAPGAG